MMRMIRKYRPFFVKKIEFGVIIMKNMKSPKKRASKVVGKLVFVLTQVLCIMVFVYAGLELFSIFRDYKVASDEYEKLANHLVTEMPVEETTVSEEINVKKESVLDLPYDYEIPEYQVNLETVKEQNSDTVGWIILPDSKINYPIVKSKDNTEYLTTTFEGQTANSGAIFMDMYCPADFNCDNTIIYGHNMKNGSMFRALNNMTNKEFFWRHHIFSINTGSGFEEYEVISCYETVETDLTSWQISFESLDAYETWLKTVTMRCTYDCADYDVTKKTITLSTCRGQSGGPGRFIVHLQKR